MTNEIARLPLSFLIRFAIAILISTASCTGKYEPPQDTLVVAISAQPSTLDPRYAMDATGSRIGGIIFQGFVRMGDNFSVIPEAAERYELNHRTYTFYLRQDLKFHNGRPLKIEDLQFTFDTFLGDKSPFKSSLKTIKSYRFEEKNGQLLAHIEMTRLADNFLINEVQAIRILPKQEIEQLGADFNQALIGTGPYKFVRQTLNEIRLEAVSAKTKNLVFKVIRDDLTRYQKMIKGEVDVAQNELPREKIDEFRKRAKDFHVITYPGLSMSYLLINMKDPLLQKFEVREALALSLQREEINKYKNYGLAQEATSLLAPQNPYHNSSLKNLPPDLPRAQKMVQQLGLKKKGIVLKTSNTPSALDGARVLANQMSRSGINVEVESYEWGTFYDDVKKGRVQLALMKWVGLIDPDIYRLAFHSKEVPPGRNRGSYMNPEVDKLVEKGDQEESRERRKKIYDEVQAIVLRDLAVIPLWYETQVAIARKSVSNYTPNMNGDYHSLVGASK